MRVRPMVPADLLQVLPLYAAQIAEERAGQALAYPQPTDETMPVATRQLLGAMQENQDREAGQHPPRWIGIVAEEREKIVGYAWGTIVARPLVAPHTVLRGEVAYVDPRARRKGIMRLVLAAMWEHAQNAGAEVFEAAYMPGSFGAGIWEGAGFRPYRVEAAFVGDDGHPLAHPPLARPEPELIAAEG